MAALNLNPITGEWEPETKEQVMSKTDIENKHPCELCWEAAKDWMYVWPFRPDIELLRCQCGRVLGRKK